MPLGHLQTSGTTDECKICIIGQDNISWPSNNELCNQQVSLQLTSEELNITGFLSKLVAHLIGQALCKIIRQQLFGCIFCRSNHSLQFQWQQQLHQERRYKKQMCQIGLKWLLQ
jgi:hypothetical protein